jgi:hypothetical protein
VRRPNGTRVALALVSLTVSFPPISSYPLLVRAVLLDPENGRLALAAHVLEHTNGQITVGRRKRHRPMPAPAPSSGVNPVVSTDSHHVLPSLAIDEDPNDVHVLYYTQHINGTTDVDMANSHDRGATFPANRTVRVTSTSFALAPTNIPIPSASQPYATTNYDRQIAPCYSLGEYLSVSTANGSTYALWGDERNGVTHPINALDPLSGQTHSQQDVMFQKVKAQ